MKETIKLTLGNTLLSLLPSKAERLAQAGFTLDYGGLTVTESLIRHAMIQKAVQSGDTERLAQFHRNYWLSKGDSYHESTENQFEEIFVPTFGFMIDELAERLANHPEIDTLCEIGTGNGTVLAYVAEKLPTIKRFIGIDLSKTQTAKNQSRFSDPKFEWVTADGKRWIEENGEGNWVYLTSRGVLEYFPQPVLEAMLCHIGRNLTPAYFIAIEPYGTKHNLENQLDSMTYGFEQSFSHNYRYLFTKCGFELYHYSDSYDYGFHQLCALGAISKG